MYQNQGSYQPPAGAYQNQGYQGPQGGQGYQGPQGGNQQGGNYQNQGYGQQRGPPQQYQAAPYQGQQGGNSMMQSPNSQFGGSQAKSTPRNYLDESGYLSLAEVHMVFATLCLISALKSMVSLVFVGVFDYSLATTVIHFLFVIVAIVLSCINDGTVSTVVLVASILISIITTALMATVFILGGTASLDTSLVANIFGTLFYGANATGQVLKRKDRMNLAGQLVVTVLFLGLSAELSATGQFDIVPEQAAALIAACAFSALILVLVGVDLVAADKIGENIKYMRYFIVLLWAIILGGLSVLTIGDESFLLGWIGLAFCFALKKTY